jgi:hypothetical protein
MGSISKLEVINHMLLMAGEAPVVLLAGAIETELATQIFDHHIRDIQFRGMANNRYDKKYTLTSAGTITFPANTLSAELVSGHTNDDGFLIVGILRGDATKKLWNVTDQIDIWKTGTDYWIEIIQELDWANLDASVQRSVMSSAARQYQIVVQGDGDIDRYLGEKEMFDKIRGRASDTDDKRRNIYQHMSMTKQNVLSQRPSSRRRNVRKGT